MVTICCNIYHLFRNAFNYRLLFVLFRIQNSDIGSLKHSISGSMGVLGTDLRALNVMYTTNKAKTFEGAKPPKPQLVINSVCIFC